MFGKISQTKMTAISKDIKSIFSFFSLQISLTLRHLKKEYQVNKVKTFTVILLSTFIISITTFYSITTILAPIKTSPIKQEQVIARGDIVSSFLNNGILAIFTGSIKLLSPVLDGFVGSTPDVTGFSNNNQITFTDGGVIQTAKSFYDKTFSVALVILVFLFVIVGVRFITDTENNIETLGALRELMKRFLWVAIFLIAGRIILSLTIQATNAINNVFQGGTTLSNFINTFANNLVSSNQGNILTSSAFTLLVFALILLLLFVICVQFIVRFVSLYFLAVIQPFASIFLLIKGTAGINESFWKNWFTLLIHQPFFILGFAVTESILVSSLKGTITLTPLLILLAVLLFLTSINVFVSRIFTDTWGSVHLNETSKTGRALLMGAGAFTTAKGIKGGKNLVNRIKDSKNMKVDKKDGSNQTSEVAGLDAGGYSIQSNNSGGNKYNKNKVLNDPTQSFYARQLKKDGVNVSASPQSDELLNTSGNFYASSTGNGVSTLYASVNDTIDDGIPAGNMREVSLNNASLLDSVNYNAKSNYNTRISSIAKSKGLKSSDVHITDNSTPDRIMKGMEIGKASNLKNQVQGVIVQRIGKNAQNTGDPKTAKKQIQIYVYDNYLDFNKKK